MTFEAEFVVNKETMNKVRFQELGPNGPMQDYDKKAKIGALYISKNELPAKYSKVKVTVEII